MKVYMVATERRRRFTPTSSAGTRLHSPSQ